MNVNVFVFSISKCIYMKKKTTTKQNKSSHDDDDDDHAVHSLYIAEILKFNFHGDEAKDLLVGTSLLNAYTHTDNGSAPIIFNTNN